MHKRLISSLPLVLLACMAAAGSPSSAAAKAKGSTGLPESEVVALVDLHHPRGLNRFVRAVSDPSSPRYREYSTVERLVARYGAKPQTKQRVRRWLVAHGLHGTFSSTDTFLFARLPATRAERLLPGIGGATASRLGGARAVPAALRGAVDRISLLPPGIEAQRFAGADIAAGVLETAAAPGPQASPYRSILPHSGSAAGCPQGSSGAIEPGFEPFTPNQYLTAYGHTDLHGRGLEGQGQTVAVVEVGGFLRSDVVAFAECFGVTAPPTRAIPVGTDKPLPPEDEVTLDLEMLSVGAPKLDRILVYEGGEEMADVALTAGTALGNPAHRPDVISISLGFCEPRIAGNVGVRDAFDDIFAVGAGAGISVLVSAGDQGSSGCRTVNLTNEEKTALPTLAVSLPASSPYATAVGGTNLELTAKNRIAREIVWNDSVLTPWGGGGGGSIVSPRTPWWQAGIHRYGPARKVPDISALADLVPGYAFFCTAEPCKPQEHAVFGWGSVGGTSAAAPLTAAGIALANQYAEKRGQATLGFLNPLLYRLGARKQTRGAVFNDVTLGDNDIGRALPPQAGGGTPLGCCQAKPGYDWASGWGSLKLPGFAKAAAAAAAR